jgi:dual-specificity kinase
VIDDDDDDEDPPPPPPPQPGLARTATNGSARHTDKKRKTTASTAYDPVYNQQTSYSTTQTPYYDSPNHSLSTDRTTSALNTTAATSLGSQASNGHHISPLDNSAVGQKRKSWTTTTTPLVCTSLHPTQSSRPRMSTCR